MKRRILLFATVTFACLFSAAPPLGAQDEPAAPATPEPTAPALDAPVIATSASPDYPQVTCTSADPIACAETLQVATDTRDRLEPLLKLGPTWRFPVHIHVMTPGDPLLAKINREAAAVFSEGATMKIEAVLPSTDPNPREFIQRQFVTALLWEKFFANTAFFDKQTRLDVVPFWLVEGMREWVDEDPEHNRESIVRRAVQNKTAPTLDEVTGWHELSDDRLLGLWQRAFCYYLVDIMTQQGAPRNDFQQWLAGFSAPGSSPTGQLHFPTENAWQRELADAGGRSQDVVFTWAETLAELTTDETITYAAAKDAPIQTCTLDTVATLPQTPALREAVQERIFVLTELELRAHPSWHAILELYRSALTALVNNNPEQGAKLLQDAHHWRGVQIDYHQKLLDYMNWFEVTKDYGDDATRFQAYFTTAKEMERIEADPAHPNPIRASLLQIESQL